MMQSQSQSLLFISFLLCLATTTILSNTLNIVSNSNDIIKVVISKSHRSNYIMAEAFTPQYQPSAVGVSIPRTSTSSLSSSIELPFSSTTIGQQQHHPRPQQGKGNDAAAVAQKTQTKTNAAVGMTTNTDVDPFLLHLAQHHHQHHHCHSQSRSTSAASSSSSSSAATARTTIAAAATHFAYQRPRYGRSSSRRLRLQRRLHILKITLHELEVHRRRNQN